MAFPRRTARLSRVRRTVLALVPVLLLAACGGGSGDADDSPTPSRSAAPMVSAAPRLSAVPGPTASPKFPAPKTEADRRKLLTVVFDDAQGMWQKLFAADGIEYPKATLTIFDSTVETGCGPASDAIGPFYCPADHGVYLDTSFFTALEQQFGVQGGFPPAYVVGHEVGHHVQNALGTMSQVHAAQQAHPAQENALSVRQELQADCYAGVWAHTTYSRDLLSEADLDQALHAATVIADDFQQHRNTGKIQPDQWTHGSAAQRTQWLRTGFTEGSPDSCDTFAS